MSKQQCCTISPTALLGCWAKFRVGLPPYRSGLVDGKCVWRLSRRVSLTPLCIACLDLTSTTSGKTQRSNHRTSTSTPFFPSSVKSFLLLQSIIRRVRINETEVKWQKCKPEPATHGGIKASFTPQIPPPLENDQSQKIIKLSRHQNTLLFKNFYILLKI